MRKSKFLQLSYKFKILKKLYLFYNLYIRNRKYLNNGSQFGEDKFLFNLFEKNYNGKYLDVGCFHPTKHNNTSLFYKNGWQGINIDLNPLTIDLFNFMRSNDTNINTAISSEESEKTLFFLSENNTQNTLSENQLLFLKKHHNLRDDEIIKKKIKTRRLDNILEENNFHNIDFMNLDVEGHELEVLKTINFKKTKLKYVCIEMINHNDLSIKNSDQILELLETNKFEQIKKFDFNYIFKNKEI